MKKKAANKKDIKSSKLIRLLRLLSKSEIKSLIQFSESGYFNRRVEISTLISFLASYAPDFNVEKTACFEAIFPEQTYDAALLNRIFSKSFQLAEKFVWIKEGEKKEHIRHELVAKFYAERNGLELYAKKVEDWRDSNLQLHWDDQLIRQYILAKQQKKHFSNLDARNPVDPTSNSVHIRVMNENIKVFEQFVLRESFSLTNMALTINTNIGPAIEIEEEYLSKIMNLHLERKDELLLQWKDDLRIIEAINSYELSANRNKESFFLLKDIVKNRSEEIPTQNQLNIIYYLIHFCYVELEVPGTTPPINGFELYSMLLEKKLCYVNGKLQPVAFYSLCNLAFVLEKIEWMQNFLNTRSKDLPKQAQFGLKTFFSALLEHLKGNHKKALQYLNELEAKKDRMHGFHSKRWQVMLHYELDSDKLDDAMNAFRVMLSRDKKEHPQRIKNHRIFINCLYQLVNTHHSNKTKLKKIKSKVEKYKVMFPQKWFLKKLEEKINH